MALILTLAFALGLWRGFVSYSVEATGVLGLLLLATTAVAELALRNKRMGLVLALCGLMLVEMALMCAGWIIYLVQGGAA